MRIPFRAHGKVAVRGGIQLRSERDPGGLQPCRRIEETPELADVLLHWRMRCPYPQPGDWVFASPHRRGKQPYWPWALFRVHLQPALKAAGIPGQVGWHTLRHTFGTLMKANGEDIKTLQELLRHANFKVTADTYTQAVTRTKRAAQTKSVRMILPPRAAASDQT